METACGYLDDRVMWVSTDEQRWITHLMKLKDEHPDEVTIVCEPKRNSGCLYLKCPSEWLKIQPPRRLNLSDEERILRGQRLAAGRKKLLVTNGETL